MHELFYQVSQLLLLPVLWSIYAAFIYSLFETGRFVAHGIFRHKGKGKFHQVSSNLRSVETEGSILGYPIISHYSNQDQMNLNDVEVFALGKMEVIKLITRVAPMLGLIATLVPMGPALMAMTENNVVAMSEHLRTAFTAVILALAAAALTFCIASIKRRWYAEEIIVIEKHLALDRG